MTWITYAVRVPNEGTPAMTQCHLCIAPIQELAIVKKHIIILKIPIVPNSAATI
jgi:hypothetical protein